MSEFKSCYIFTADNEDEMDQRPLKRRKTKPTSQPNSATDHPTFEPLLRGKENSRNLCSRLDIFEDLWGRHQEVINNLSKEVNATVIESIASFVKHSDHNKRSNGTIPTGLLLAGPSYGTPASLFESIASRVEAPERTISVHLNSGQSPNLKATLKHINQHGTTQASVNENNIKIHDEESGQNLSYDLEILYNYVRSNYIDRVILFIQDIEGFDVRLLSEMIDVLSSWHNRIPFVILFSIATSVELMEVKLPRHILKQLHGQQFDVKILEVEDIFKAIHSGPPISKDPHTESHDSHFLSSSKIWLGPMLSRVILDRQKDYILSPLAHTQALKYSLMAHFFANPLSVLTSLNFDGWEPVHSEAARNLMSFRRHVHHLLDQKEFKTVKVLLNDDEALKEYLETEIRTSRQALEAIVSGADLLFSIQAKTSKSKVNWSELYIKAMSGELAGSSLLEDILLPVKKLQSHLMADLLGNITECNDLPGDIKLCMTHLRQVTSEASPNGSMSLKSSYDIQHSHLRTTVVAHKVELSKHAARLTSHETAYTKIVERVFNTLNDYFKARLVNPQDLVLHELLVYDLKSPYADAFTPKPRFAVERALSSPRDYLACDCCHSAEVGLSSSQPATAILYQLYLESGNQINAADLWSAFWTVVGADGAEDEDEQQQKTSAMFSRALAELKYLGLVKGSKKKADHLSKSSWKGI